MKTPSQSQAVDPNWREYLLAALPIARGAGDLLAAHFEGPRTIELKGAINLVTEMDTRAEEYIVSRLSQRFPEFSIIAEEGSGHGLEQDLRWYVDPLDGTTNYAHGLPIFCVSMGLWQVDHPVCAIVYHPLGNEMYTAVRGEGAYLGERRLAVSHTNRLEDAILATGFPYDIRETQHDNLDIFAHFAKRPAPSGVWALQHSISPGRSAGRFDGFWEMKLSPWDVAASVLICTEAGAIVSDFSGGPFDLTRGEAVAANPALHPQIIADLRQIRSSTPGLA